MLIIITPDKASQLMQGENAEWYQFGTSNEWTLVHIKFEDLVGKHTQIMDWIAKEIPTDVYGALYNIAVFPSQEEIDKKLAAIDAWVKEGKDSGGLFKKIKENIREKERATREENAKASTQEQTGYVFCFCTSEDALKFKMVWR